MGVSGSMSGNENHRKYDCMTCPYPRYKDSRTIFCDVCIQKILDEQREKKRRKEKPDGE
ncbi:hypothetical protein AALA36_18660 [Lachnospiraceae bacterium 66-29]